MNRNYVVISLLFFLIVTGCQDKTVRLVESWKAGTSSGLFNDFSQQEFDNFKAAGIEYIEIGSGVFRNKTDAECQDWVEDIRKKAEVSGIKVWSVHLPFSRVYDISSDNDTNRINMIQECIRIMNLCEPLKVSKYVIHPSAEPIPDSIRSIRVQNSISSLRILSEEVKKVNGQLAVECLPRTCLGNTSDELLMIVNSVNNGLGICLDTNHLLKEKPEEFAAKAGSLIVTLHVSDYDGIDERHWLPGKGIINWTTVVGELAKSGYDGPFMFEASRRKPASDGTADPSKLTVEELYGSFDEIKSNFRKSL